MTKPVGLGFASNFEITEILYSRCQLKGCNRRITLAMQDVVCRCEKIFCEKHLPPEKHSCTFDWKAHEQEQLSKKLMKESTQSKHSSGYGGGSNFAH